VRDAVSESEAPVSSVFFFRGTSDEDLLNYFEGSI
jgi:hypothetical protein